MGREGLKEIVFVSGELGTGKTSFIEANSTSNDIKLIFDFSKNNPTNPKDALIGGIMCSGCSIPKDYAEIITKTLSIESENKNGKIFVEIPNTMTVSAIISALSDISTKSTIQHIHLSNIVHSTKDKLIDMFNSETAGMNINFLGSDNKIINTNKIGYRSPSKPQLIDKIDKVHRAGGFLKPIIFQENIIKYIDTFNNSIDRLKGKFFDHKRKQRYLVHYGSDKKLNFEEIEKQSISEHHIEIATVTSAENTKENTTARRIFNKNFRHKSSSGSEKVVYSEFNKLGNAQEIMERNRVLDNQNQNKILNELLNKPIDKQDQNWINELTNYRVIMSNLPNGNNILKEKYFKSYYSYYSREIENGLDKYSDLQLLKVLEEILFPLTSEAQEYDIGITKENYKILLGSTFEVLKNYEIFSKIKKAQDSIGENNVGKGKITEMYKDAFSINQ